MHNIKSKIFNFKNFEKFNLNFLIKFRNHYRDLYLKSSELFIKTRRLKKQVLSELNLTYNLIYDF
jgi:hypothetical protein